MLLERSVIRVFTCTPLAGHGDYAAVASSVSSLKKKKNYRWCVSFLCGTRYWFWYLNFSYFLPMGYGCMVAWKSFEWLLWNNFPWLFCGNQIGSEMSDLVHTGATSTLYHNSKFTKVFWTGDRAWAWFVEGHQYMAYLLNAFLACDCRDEVSGQIKGFNVDIVNAGEYIGHSLQQKVLYYCKTICLWICKWANLMCNNSIIQQPK